MEDFFLRTNGSKVIDLYVKEFFFLVCETKNKVAAVAKMGWCGTTMWECVGSNHRA